MIPEGKVVWSEMMKGRMWEVRGACTQTRVHGHRARGAVPTQRLMTASDRASVKANASAHFLWSKHRQRTPPLLTHESSLPCHEEVPRLPSCPGAPAVALNYISLGCTQQFNSTNLYQISRLIQISGQCGIRKDQGRAPPSRNL